MSDNSKGTNGNFNRFWAWCKRKWKTLFTLGTLTVILMVAQILIPIIWPSGPDYGKELTDALVKVQEDNRALQPVAVPDSLLVKSESLQLLKSYQDEYEEYLMACKLLDFSKLKGRDFRDLSLEFSGRHNALLNYLQKTSDLNKKVELIAEKVPDVQINASKILAVGEAIAKVVSTLKPLNLNAAKGMIGGYDIKTEDGLKKFYSEQIQTSEMLDMVNSCSDAFKSIYLACSAKMKEEIKTGDVSL